MRIVPNGVAVMRGLLKSMLFGSLLMLFSGGYALGEGTDTQQELLDEVGLDQKLGAQVPLDLEFFNSDGEPVVLGDLVREKPVILTLVYYECPMLCTLILNGTLKALRALEFSVGEEFDVVTVSINPKETPDLHWKRRLSIWTNIGGRVPAKGGIF